MGNWILLYSPEERRDLALECGDQGRFANANNLLSQSTRFLLASDDAVDIVSTMEARVKGTWVSVMRSAGVSEQDCAQLAGAFAYAGFRQF